MLWRERAESLDPRSRPLPRARLEEAAAAQRERRLTDTHHERITPGAGLSEDLHLLAVHEAELEEPALEPRESRIVRADPDDVTDGARAERRECRPGHRQGLRYRTGGGPWIGPRKQFFAGEVAADPPTRADQYELAEPAGGRPPRGRFFRLAPM